MHNDQRALKKKLQHNQNAWAFVESKKREIDSAGIWRACAGMLLSQALFGCSHSAIPELCRPGDYGRCIVEEVDIEGTSAVSAGDIKEAIATAETYHLFGGAFRNVPILSILDAAALEYERFDSVVLERDLARIERYYKGRGFYDARVRASRVSKTPDGRVRVEIVIDEGEPLMISRVDLEWKDWSLPLAKDVTAPVTEAKNELKVGMRFEEEAYEKAKNKVLRAMTDQGFAYAEVQGKVAVDLPTRTAKIVFRIELGPKCSFGEIKFIGLGSIPEAPLRSALGFEPKHDFSMAALESAEIALADFGIFGSVDVRPLLDTGNGKKNTVIPVEIYVQPSALRAIRAGLGAQVGSLVEAHVLGGWENRNFLGGLRRFSVELKPGLVFYPWNINTILSELPENVLPQFQMRFDIRQPVPFDTRTGARLSGELNIWSPPQTVNSNLPYILGYRSYLGAFGFDRPWLDAYIHSGLFYNLEFNDPFSYNDDKTIDQFDYVIISSIRSAISLDLRLNSKGERDPVEPNRGLYFETEFQWAGLGLGGTADDLRLSPEARFYVPISKKVTLALRTALGFVLLSDYSERCKGGFSDCSEPELNEKVQLLGLRGYFSGGANSNRGYSYRGIGPHAIVPSFFGGSGAAASADPVAVGGLSLWEASLELRFPMYYPVGASVFIDASDVSLDSFKLRFTRPHLSAGFGLRYATPVGPARLDFGFRIPCAQVFGVCDPAQIARDYPEEGSQGVLGGFPLAVSLAIGEAF